MITTATMSSASDDMKRQVNRPEIHRDWEETYRTDPAERFREAAYDRMVARLGQPAGSSALDIGCGRAYNAARLARRGYQVTGADYSEPILEDARECVRRQGLEGRIRLQREDILGLSFPDGSFDLVHCWGVLMHIPDIGRALAELVRVAKPGGFLVIEEMNLGSPESRLMRGLWRMLKRGKIRLARTPSGVEHTCAFAGEALFWRHTDARWLIGQLGSLGCSLVRRDSGQCTDLSIYAPGLLERPLQAWNRFWLSRVNLPALAYHNVWTFRRDP